MVIQYLLMVVQGKVFIIEFLYKLCLRKNTKWFWPKYKENTFVTAYGIPTFSVVCLVLSRIVVTVTLTHSLTATNTKPPPTDPSSSSLWRGSPS